MHARAWGAVLFRIVYRSSYTVLLGITAVLLGTTPGDHIYQTIENNNRGNIFVVIGTIVVTAAIAVFVYASRLYTNRATLSSIPKPYVPISDGEVADQVWREITRNRHRSALIAWESRPRDLRAEEQHQQALAREQEGLDGQVHARHGVSPVSSSRPPWGVIEHPGWTAPADDELPNLDFATVVAELPHLIEAKAVSLAPPDPTFMVIPEDPDEIPPPDSRIVALLQRPPHAGLRDYVASLEAMRVLKPPELVEGFLAKYEYARFSGTALLESEFKELMESFSDVLVSMDDLDLAVIEELLPDEAQDDAASGMASLNALTAQSRRPSMEERGRRPTLRRYASDSSSSSMHSVVRHSVSSRMGYA